MFCHRCLTKFFLAASVISICIGSVLLVILLTMFAKRLDLTKIEHFSLKKTLHSIGYSPKASSPK